MTKLNYDLPDGTPIVLASRTAKVVGRARAAYQVRFDDNGELLEIYHGHVALQAARAALDEKRAQEANIYQVPMSRYEIMCALRSLATANDAERTDTEDKPVNTWLAERLMKIVGVGDARG